MASSQVAIVLVPVVRLAYRLVYSVHLDVRHQGHGVELSDGGEQLERRGICAAGAWGPSYTG
jgi:hypothetical protein